MKARIMQSETLRGLWGCHLSLSSYIILFLMLVTDWLGWLITFGQQSGESLLERFGRGE